MSRFFTPAQNISQDEIIINDPAQVHHLKDVLRNKVKRQVEIFDEDNNVYQCLITSVSKKGIVLQIINKVSVSKINKMHITIACAIPKKSKFDFIVEKTTELGVERIIPLITQRTIARFKSDQIDNKLKRWQRIAIEAAKQSNRSNLPIIEPPLKFSLLFQRFPDFDCLLIPNLYSKKRINLLNATGDIKGKRDVLLLIGPEGDFSPRELELVRTHKAIEISLGDTVLKVETAALVCLGLLSLLNAEFKS